MSDAKAARDRLEPDLYYTPDRVRQLLKRFLELEAMAETPASSAHLKRAPRPGATPAEPRAGARSKGSPADPMRWVVVVADIRKAWILLTYQSIEWRVVEAQLQGHTLKQFAEAYRRAGRHIRQAEVYAANDRAVEKMAVSLGWTPVEEAQVAS